MAKRLIFIRGMWDTLDVFSRGMEQYFVDIGEEIFVLDTVNLLESLARLYSFIQKPVDAVITFNNVGLNIELICGKNLWNELNILCVNIIVDHPVCYMQELQMAPKRTMVICVDKNHVEFVKRHFTNIEAVHFMPHGGMKYEDGRQWKKRDIDVLYAGGLHREVAAGYIPQNINKIAGIDNEELCEKVLERMIVDTKCTLEKAVEDYIIGQGIMLSDEQLLHFIRVFRFIDVYASSYYREKTVKMLVENGIHVTVYGNGWDKCEWISHSEVDYYSCVSPEEILSLMGRTKIVLNSMPNFRNGSHERVFNGMLAGSAVVSDTSYYLEDEAAGREYLYLYNLDNQYELPDIVRYILSHQDDMNNITRAACEVAEREHTWQQRAQLLEKYIEQYQSGNTI